MLGPACKYCPYRKDPEFGSDVAASQGAGWPARIRGWLVGCVTRGRHSHADRGTVDFAKGGFEIPRGADAAAPMMRA